MRTVTIEDGREIALHGLDAITPAQADMLLTCAVDLLVRAGGIRDDVALDGPSICQFLGEMADRLDPREDADRGLPISSTGRGPRYSMGYRGFRGTLQIDGSKTGLRYAQVTASEPYPHDVRLRIVARPDQDDDALNEALDDLVEVPVAISARIDRDEDVLVCTTDDIVRL